MSKLIRQLQTYVSNGKQVEAMVFAKWPSSPASTDVMFRFGSRFYKRSMDDLALPVAKRVAISRLPGSDTNIQS